MFPNTDALQIRPTEDVCTTLPGVSYIDKCVDISTFGERGERREMYGGILRTLCRSYLTPRIPSIQRFSCLLVLQSRSSVTMYLGGVSRQVGVTDRPR